MKIIIMIISEDTIFSHKWKCIMHKTSQNVKCRPVCCQCKVVLYVSSPANNNK